MGDNYPDFFSAVWELTKENIKEKYNSLAGAANSFGEMIVSLPETIPQNFKSNLDEVIKTHPGVLAQYDQACQEGKCTTKHDAANVAGEVLTAHNLLISTLNYVEAGAQTLGLSQQTVSSVEKTVGEKASEAGDFMKKLFAGDYNQQIAATLTEIKDGMASHLPVQSGLDMFNSGLDAIKNGIKR